MFLPIITAGQLRSAINNSELRLIDARQGKDAHANYLKSHLKGAGWANLEKDLSSKSNPAEGGRHPLPHVEHFSIWLGKMGITPDMHVVIYDDTSGAIAGARLWWMLKAAGHQKVQLLDGGLKAAMNAGLAMERGMPKFEPVPPYPLKSWQLPMADLGEVQHISKNRTGIIIDVRAADRYRGETEPIDPVAGHIPGALNIPYSKSIDQEGKFRSKEELQQLFSTISDDGNFEQVVVHCGSGVTACHTILAMDIAGLPLPYLYVGSWSEWCRVMGKD